LLGLLTLAGLFIVSKTQEWVGELRNPAHELYFWFYCRICHAPPARGYCRPP